LALWVKGFWISYFADIFGDLDREHEIDNGGLCGFIGRSDLFDDFFTHYSHFMLINLFNSVLCGILMNISN
jgi:hypothetical protein